MGVPTASRGIARGVGLVAVLAALAAAHGARAEVLWNQPMNPEGGMMVPTQQYESTYYTSELFLADNFVATSTWTITKIFVPGHILAPTVPSLMDASTLNWRIYADAGGKPAGDPHEGGAPPVWSVSLPPSDSQVLITQNGMGYFMTDTTLVPSTPIVLPAGTYWLSFYPALTYVSPNHGYYWWVCDSTHNDPDAQTINPGGARVPVAATWTSIRTVHPSLTDQDLAFRLEGVGSDSVPDAFAFVSQTGVPLSSVRTSNPITVTGIDTPTPVSVTGGEYRINSGSYTSTSGTVHQGNTVTVRQTSAASYSTTTDAVLTIGGVSAAFTVTTLAAPQDGGQAEDAAPGHDAAAEDGPGPEDAHPAGDVPGLGDAIGDVAMPPADGPHSATDGPVAGSDADFHDIDSPRSCGCIATTSVGDSAMIGLVGIVLLATRRRPRPTTGG